MHDTENLNALHDQKKTDVADLLLKLYNNFSDLYYKNNYL